MEEIIIVVICLILNALLAAAEMAFVSVGRPELRAYAAKGHKKAAILLRLRQNPERILSVLQIGISLVGAIAAAVSGAGADDYLRPILQENYHLSDNTAEILAIVIIVIPLTYLNVVFGELVPKALSLKKPHTIALAAAPWLTLFDKALSPLVSILEKSTKLVIRVFFPSSSEIVPTTDEIVELSEVGTQAKLYILNLINAEKKGAQEVMIPWSSVSFVRKEQNAADVKRLIMESKNTRLPILNGDNVVSMIHAKEVLTAIETGSENWIELARPIIQTRLREPILEILLKMEKNRNHMAVVFDRLEVVGIVTLEDIVEEIVGEIFDEGDEDRIKKILSSRLKK